MALGVRLASRRCEPAGQQAQGQGAGAVAGGRADDVVGAALDEPAQLGDQAGQAAPFDKLHGEIRDAVDGADGMHRHDVRVLEQAGDLGLELKPLEGLRVHRGGQRQDLQGDPAAERGLPRLVHDPHAAPADLADDVEVGEDLAPRPARLASAPAVVPSPVVDRFELGEPLQDGQDLLERVGLLGMGRHELVDVDGLAGQVPPRILVGQLGQGRVERQPEQVVGNGIRRAVARRR